MRLERRGGELEREMLEIREVQHCWHRRQRKGTTDQDNRLPPKARKEGETYSPPEPPERA